MTKFITTVFALALVLLPGFARAESATFTSAEYDCLKALGKELYEDYSQPVIDALPAYLKDTLRKELNSTSCNDAAVMQLISARIGDEDAAALAPYGLTPLRVQILPEHLNVHLNYVLHDPDIPDSSRKTLIRGLIAREMPPSFAKLTDDDLVFLNLNMTEGEVLQRMPPNLIQQLHDIINDPKLAQHDLEKHDKTRALMEDERLTATDIAYLNSIGHHEDYLTNPNTELHGVHFVIADTTISDAEKQRRVNGLIKPENSRRTSWENKLRRENLFLMLTLFFPLIAVAVVPLGVRVFGGSSRWERLKPKLPWIVFWLVAIWAMALIIMFFPDLLKYFKR